MAKNKRKQVGSTPSSPKSYSSGDNEKSPLQDKPPKASFEIEGKSKSKKTKVKQQKLEKEETRLEKKEDSSLVLTGLF